MRDTTKLFLKSALFAAAAPGTVAVVLPLLLVRGREAGSGAALGVALIPLAIGAAIFLWCARDFVVAGRGTPAPIDQPERLVVRGLYRYSRNPMYVGVLSMIAGWTVLFSAPILAVYAAAWFVIFSLFVRFYEEPHLTRKFGDEYTAYRRRVGRWLPKRSRGNVLCLLSGVLLGCGDSGPEEVPGSTPEWTLRRDLTIGSVDHPVYAFSGVRRVLADQDHVYALLIQEAVVRVFTREGEFVRDLGREGEGPGELLMPSDMGWHGSRLWVANWGSNRFTFFDIETGDAETVPFRPDIPRTRYTSDQAPGAVLSNGNLVGSPKLSATAVTAGFVTADVRIVTDTTGVVRDTLAVLSIAGQVGEITAGLGGNARSYRLHPLPEDDMMAFAPDGSAAVFVSRTSWAGSGPAAFDVTRVDPRGDTLFHRSIPYEPRRVPEGFFDDEIAESLEYRDFTDRRAYADALREFLEQREYFPPVARLVAGSDGTTWLAGPDEDGERSWLILDASGAPIGRVRLPARSSVSFANESECWVVERDALDIPYVVRYDIAR